MSAQVALLGRGRHAGTAAHSSHIVATLVLVLGVLGLRALKLDVEDRSSDRSTSYPR